MLVTWLSPQKQPFFSQLMATLHTYVLWLGKVQKLALKETNQFEDIVLLTFILSLFNKLPFLKRHSPNNSIRI